MGNFLKLLPLILKFNDVTAYLGPEHQQVDGKPFYYTQRFWGAVSALVIGAAGYYSIDLVQLGFGQDIITENLTELAKTIGGVIGALYGTAMLVKGVLDANKRKVETVQK